MSTWALVPMKRRSQSKSRLAPCLPPAERLALTRAMLGHVLATLRAVPAIERIALVSMERDDVPRDILRLPDPAGDLNGSLVAALAAAAANGVRRALIISGDLPTVNANEIGALLRSAGPTAVALAPDRAGRGTNAIVLPLPGGFHPRFGADSFSRHHLEAAHAGFTPHTVDAPGLAFDVDTPEDLAALGASLPR